MGKFIVGLISLVATAVISFIAAAPFLLFGLSWASYWSAFAVIFAIQLFLGGCWNYFVNTKNRAEQRRLKAADELADAVQNIEISCAYCHSNNMVPILVGHDNRFICSTCKEKNAVMISCAAARTTDPIMPKAELAEIFRNLDVSEGDDN